MRAILVRVFKKYDVFILISIVQRVMLQNWSAVLSKVRTSSSSSIATGVPPATRDPNTRWMVSPTPPR